MLVECLMYISIILLCIYIICYGVKQNKYKLIMLVIQIITTYLTYATINFKIINNDVISIIISVFGMLPNTIYYLLKIFKINIDDYFMVAEVNIYKSLNKRKKAKDFLNKYIEKKPKSNLAHREIAGIYEKEGGLRKAIDEYLKAIELNNYDYKSLYSCVKLLGELDKKEEAQELIEYLISIKPDYADAYILYATILEKEGRYKDAAKVYERGLISIPDSFEMTYNLAAVYVEINDFDKATKTFERAIELKPDSDFVKFHLGQLNFIQGNLENSTKYFEEIVKVKSLEDISNFELARIVMIYGKEELAVTYLNTALSINPDLIHRLNDEEIFENVKDKVFVSVKLDDSSDINIPTKVLKVISHLENMSSLINIMVLNTKKQKTRKLIDDIIKQTLNVDQMTLEQYKRGYGFTDEQKDKFENIEHLLEKYKNEDYFIKMTTNESTGKHEKEKIPELEIFDGETYNDITEIKDLTKIENESEVILEEKSPETLQEKIENIISKGNTDNIKILTDETMDDIITQENSHKAKLEKIKKHISDLKRREEEEQIINREKIKAKSSNILEELLEEQKKVVTNSKILKKDILLNKIDKKETIEKTKKTDRKLNLNIISELEEKINKEKNDDEHIQEINEKIKAEYENIKLKTTEEIKNLRNENIKPIENITISEDKQKEENNKKNKQEEEFLEKQKRMLFENIRRDKNN